MAFHLALRAYEGDPIPDQVVISLISGLGSNTLQLPPELSREVIERIGVSDEECPGLSAQSPETASSTGTPPGEDQSSVAGSAGARQGREESCTCCSVM